MGQNGYFFYFIEDGVNLAKNRPDYQLLQFFFVLD